jgi:hypothetical protein
MTPLLSAAPQKPPIPDRPSSAHGSNLGYVDNPRKRESGMSSIRKLLKNKSGIRGAFFEPENWLFKHHVYHTKNHKLTTKTPRFGTCFCRNPQQKRGNITPKKLLQ